VARPAEPGRCADHPDRDAVGGLTIADAERSLRMTIEGMTMPERMSLAKRLRERVVDGPQSLGADARARRWEVFRSAFPDIEQMSVLDLGGTTDAWRRAPVTPKCVVVLNLTEPGTSDDASVTPVEGDACAARQVLAAAGLEQSYDVVFSNSLLEHVGGHANRLAVAEEVRALAPYHWIQTPNRHFPVEPHWLFPGMQFLPFRARTTVAARWPLAHTPARSFEDARESVSWTELISVSELRAYFPDSVIFKERMAGLTKSITAVRAPRPLVSARR
jgi:hypothetical protein